MSENPELDIWQALSRFSFPSNVENYVTQKHGNAPSVELVDFVSGSMKQAEAYFKLAKSAPLDISPLLTYYGSINLLAASCSLVNNSKPKITGHGAAVIVTATSAALAPVTTTIPTCTTQTVRLTPPNVRIKLGEIEIRTTNPLGGGMQVYANTFAPSLKLQPGITWKLEEIIGSVPDLKDEFENCYASSIPFVIPVEIIKMRDKTFERIANSDLARFGTNFNWTTIKNFNKNYLAPQETTDYVILNRKLSFSEDGIYSISGRKFLEVGHLKGGVYVHAGPVITPLMGLFALSYLSRYLPEIWSPFVRIDGSGERLVIERFISVLHRQLPNLVLNLITGGAQKYVYEIDGIKDLTSTYTEAEIQQLVNDKVEEAVRARNVRI